jgi:hypothetical protein
MTRSMTKCNTLFASLTTIVCVCVCVCVCSAWFADAAWSALGGPDAWLHCFYQGVLAPVRGLWHVWPKYKDQYSHYEQAYSLAESFPDFFGLMHILAQVLLSIVMDLAAPAIFVGCTSCHFVGCPNCHAVAHRWAAATRIEGHGR